MKLFSLFSMLLTLPLLVAAPPCLAQAGANTDGFIIGKEERLVTENGLIVETQDTWVANSNTFFELTLDTPYPLRDGDFLAIDFEVTRHVYDYFICKFGVNGQLFAVGAEGSDTVINHPALHNGSIITVTQKFGFFFFFSGTFKGTIYISRDYIGTNEALETEIRSFRVQYDSSNVSRHTTIVWHELYVVNQEYLPAQQGTLLFDFHSLVTNDDKTINDNRFIASENLTVSNDNRETLVTSIEGVNLVSSLDYAMIFGMRSKSDGAVDLSSEEFAGAYTNNVLSLLKFDLGDRTFVPHDGFAFNFYAITNCYFKVIVEDENGNRYMPNIPSSGSNTFNCVNSLSVVNTVEGRYEAFYVNAKQTGTIYVPYSSLIDCRYFQGEAVTNSGTLGQIRAIYLGIAFSLSPGRRIIFGAFSDVSVGDEKVVTIFDTAKLSHEELNYDNLSASTFAYPIGTSQHHIDNLKIEKANPSLLSSYKHLELLLGLIARCREIDPTKYTKESYENLRNVLLTVELSMDNEYLSQAEFNVLYEKLSKAYFNLVLAYQGSQINGNLILLIASSCLALGGISFLLTTLVKLRKRR